MCLCGSNNKLLGGLQDNGVKYRKDNTSAFYHIDGADGFDIVFNPVNGQPAYSSINTIVAKYSSDGANSIQCTSLPNEQYFKTLVVHNTDTSIVMAGAGTGIYRSQNSGSTWTSEGGKGSWSMASCPSNNTRFYASGGTNSEPGPGGGLYFSSNTGDTWTIKSFNPGFPDTSLWRRISDVTVHPANSSQGYASFGGFTAGV